MPNFHLKIQGPGLWRKMRDWPWNQFETPGISQIDFGMTNELVLSVSIFFLFRLIAITCFEVVIFTLFHLSLNLRNITVFKK